MLGELQRRNIHSFLLVTSDYHSARARRIFLATEHATGYAPEFRTVTAPGRILPRRILVAQSRGPENQVFIEWWKTPSPTRSAK